MYPHSQIAKIYPWPTCEQKRKNPHGPLVETDYPEKYFANRKETHQGGGRENGEYPMEKSSLFMCLSSKRSSQLRTTWFFSSRDDLLCRISVLVGWYLVSYLFPVSHEKAIAVDTTYPELTWNSAHKKKKTTCISCFKHRAKISITSLNSSFPQHAVLIVSYQQTLRRQQ